MPKAGREANAYIDHMCVTEFSSISLSVSRNSSDYNTFMDLAYPFSCNCPGTVPIPPMFICGIILQGHDVVVQGRDVVVQGRRELSEIELLAIS